MKRMELLVFSALVMLGVAVAGCAGNQSTAPETTSSASSVPYAVEWADRLKTLNARYRDGSKQAREESKAFTEYPDALDDPEWITVHEAVKLGIPVVGVVDSNNSPDNVDYVIPGNDDSIRAIQIYVQGAADAVDEGRTAMAQVGGTAEDEFVEVAGGES